MLNRRRLIALLAFLTAAAGCGRPTLQPLKSALVTLEISLPPERTTELLEKLRAFARANGFRIWVGAEETGMGTRNEFELRRSDIWIDGFNLPRDTPAEVPMGSDGQPNIHLEIDAGRFTASFYAGEVAPRSGVLTAIVTAFRSSLTSVEGVVVTVQPPVPASEISATLRDQE